MSLAKKMSDYARLVIQVGVNLQPGQPLMINCPIERADFARELAQAAWAAGASDVNFNWGDDELTLLYFQNAPQETLETVPDWKMDRMRYYYERNAASISVHATDPELLTDVDSQRIETATKAGALARKPLVHYTMNDEVSWCVVSVPTSGWAQRVFPDLSAVEAMDKLWDAILAAVRIQEGDPVQNWEDHIADMAKHAAWLNERKFTQLHYSNSLGTNLTVKLPQGHIWPSAGSVNQEGTRFVANIPTEEVFTAPHREGVDGVLYSSKPLNYNGNLIDGMRFEFQNGLCVKWSAEVGQSALDAMLNLDPENGRRLGEVALVPYSSPISLSGIVFKNTLFDENASCHFAFGKGYPTCLEGGTELSETELLEVGVNDSLIHEDFMVGTPDLRIDGTDAAGKVWPIFRDGNWDAEAVL